MPTRANVPQILAAAFQILETAARAITPRKHFFLLLIQSSRATPVSAAGHAVPS